ELRVLGEVDGPHAALAEQFEQPVAAERGRQLLGKGTGRLGRGGPAGRGRRGRLPTRDRVCRRRRRGRNPGGRMGGRRTRRPRPGAGTATDARSGPTSGRGEVDACGSIIGERMGGGKEMIRDRRAGGAGEGPSPAPPARVVEGRTANYRRCISASVPVVASLA